MQTYFKPTAARVYFKMMSDHVNFLEDLRALTILLHIKVSPRALWWSVAENPPARAGDTISQSLVHKDPGHARGQLSP